MIPYDFNLHCVDEALVNVSRRLKKVFDREAWNVQQSACDGARGAAEKTGGSFANALVAIYKRLGFIVGQDAGTGESARPEASSSHTASRAAQAGASSTCPSSGHGSRKRAPPSAMPNSPKMFNSRDY